MTPVDDKVPVSARLPSDPHFGSGWRLSRAFFMQVAFTVPAKEKSPMLSLGTGLEIMRVAS